MGDVPIANPCGLDFREMTRAEANRRFCGACKKHVHDLTLLTEAEARSLLSSKPTEKLCIRYVADARGRLVFRPDVPSSRLRRSSAAVTVAAASVAVSLASGCAGALEEPHVQMMGEMPAVELRPETATSYELSRGSTRVSLTDVPGIFVNEAAPPPANPTFVEGRCAGDAEGCSVVTAALSESRSTAELIAKLQSRGFALVQQVRGPCPPKIEQPPST